MKKKIYIIVGDNNFWYSTTRLITEKELETEIKFVKQAIKDKCYDNNDATELSVYEAKFVKTVKTGVKL